MADTTPTPAQRTRRAAPSSPRLPRPATQTSIWQPAASPAAATVSLPAAPSHTATATDTQQIRDPAEDYERIITFSPPRSSSSYRLHDYTSSPVPSSSYAADEGEMGEGTPPVSSVEWPLPAGGLRGNAEAVGGVRGAAGAAGAAGTAGIADMPALEGRPAGDRRSIMSLGVTALPRVYMSEVYRPKGRARARSEADLLCGFGAAGLRAGIVDEGGESDGEDGSGDGQGETAGADPEGKGKEKGFKERVRGWFRAAKKQGKGVEAPEKVGEAENEVSTGPTGPEQEEEGGEQVDFLEALMSTSPPSRMCAGGPAGQGAAAPKKKRIRFEAREAGLVAPLRAKVKDEKHSGESTVLAVGNDEREDGESELSQLRRENTELKRENELLKKQTEK